MKKHFRGRQRKVLADMPAEQVELQSAQACRLLVEQPEYQQAEIMMVYLPLATEVDPTPLALRAWQDRKRVLAPRVSWEQRRMIPVTIQSLTRDVAVTGLGLREPVAGTPFPISLIDLVIVPGLGFDAYGNRLGRGRGFYDRFLASPDFEGTACGLAFEQQFLPELPVGPLDRAVDLLVTDTTVRRFNNKHR